MWSVRVHVQPNKAEIYFYNKDLGISFNERKGFSHPAKFMLGYLAQRVDGIRCHHVFDRHHILIVILSILNHLLFFKAPLL